MQREELIWPDDRAAWREAWRQSLESNGVSALVLRVMPRDRPPLWINVRWVIFDLPAAPKAVRIAFWDTHFATPDQLAREGLWWERKLLGVGPTLNCR